MYDVTYFMSTLIILFSFIYLFIYLLIQFFFFCNLATAATNSPSSIQQQQSWPRYTTTNNGYEFDLESGGEEFDKRSDIGDRPLRTKRSRSRQRSSVTSIGNIGGSSSSRLLLGRRETGREIDQSPRYYFTL